MNIVKTYIVFADFFFQEKVFKFVHVSLLILHGLNCDDFFISVQFIYIIKRKANSTIEQQKFKDRKNVINF